MIDMLHTMTVPPRLQQPLYIDTDINYDLDMSKFPGLDDPQHMYQPALLIATPEVNTPVQYCEESFSGIIPSHCSNSALLYTESATKDELDDLLNIIDSCSSELLDRLVDTSIQNQVTKTGKNMYKSVMDACVYNPEIDTIPRNTTMKGIVHAGNTYTTRINQVVHENTQLTSNTHVVPRDTDCETSFNHDISRNTSVHHPTSDLSTMMDYYSEGQYSRQTCDIHVDLSNKYLNKSSINMPHGVIPNHVSNCSQGFLVHSAPESLGCKRKRSFNSSDFPERKRLCSTSVTTNYARYSEGYTSYYQTFHELVHSRGLMV